MSPGRARSATSSPFARCGLGATGIITDGAVRDTPAVAEMDIPVYHFASHAATFGRLHMPLDHQIPISCAGVTVIPGRHHRRRRRGCGRHPARPGRRDRRRPRWSWKSRSYGRSSGSTRARAPSACSRSPRIAVPSTKRGLPPAKPQKGSPEMARQSIEVESFKHVNPIPSASRDRPAAGLVGDRRASASRRAAPRPPPRSSTPTASTTSARCSPLPAAAGEHVARITFYVPDLSYRDACNPIWISAFPRSGVTPGPPHPDLYGRSFDDHLRVHRLHRILIGGEHHGHPVPAPQVGGR